MAGDPPPRIGVLALQGDVVEHERILTAVGASPSRVRTAAQLAAVDGLVIPGGESTVIDKLARTFGLDAAVRAAVADGMPVLGTCAGMVLLADRVVDAAPGQQTFGGLDITVQRNAFGPQTASFETTVDLPAVSAAPVRAAFIRAPVVLDVGPGVEVLAALDDGTVVAVARDDVIALAFHPEAVDETAVHAWFAERVRTRAGARPVE